MPPVPLLLTYCVLILAASIGGGWIPIVVRLTHRRMEVAVSFVSGVMLGVALLHLVPHAWSQQVLAAEERGVAAGLDGIMGWLLAGFLVTFFLERFFRFHHHEATSEEGKGEPPEIVAAGPSFPHQHASRRAITWVGAMIGLSVHSLIEGVALAASVAADSEGERALALAGAGTFLVILLHKPFDSMTIGTLLAVAGRSVALRHLINACFGLLVPLGVVAFFVGFGADAGHGNPWVGHALAFCAGTFLCIALSDLLPELQFHQHDRVKLSAALVLGVAVAWAVGFIEGEAHGHGPAHSDVYEADGVGSPSEGARE